MNSSVLKQIDLPIEGMTCAACAARIEKNLNKLPGVRAAVNFTNEKARVEFDATATSPKTWFVRSKKRDSRLCLNPYNCKSPE